MGAAPAVAAGHSNADIARQLFLSENTVRKHLENIYQRLSVSSRTAAVAHAFQSGYQPTSRLARNDEPVCGMTGRFCGGI